MISGCAFATRAVLKEAVSLKASRKLLKKQRGSLAGDTAESQRQQAQCVGLKLATTEHSWMLTASSLSHSRTVREDSSSDGIYRENQNSTGLERGDQALCAQQFKAR